MQTAINSDIGDYQVQPKESPTQIGTQTRIKIRPHNDKPFKIEKLKQSSESSSAKRFNKLLQCNQLNPQTLPFTNPQSSQLQNFTAYESDFQFYEEDVEESIINQHKLGENMNQLAATRKKNNYSAVLPRIDKIIAGKSNGKNRYTKMAGQEQRIMKSTIDLREENKKMVRDIEMFRNLLPIFKRNQNIISKQSWEIDKIKSRRMKFFDVDYELSLDKKMQKQTQNIESIGEKIKCEQSMLRYKRSRVRKNYKGLKVSQIRQEEIEEQQSCLVGQLIRLRQHMLSKRREQVNYNKKLQELQEKISQYNSTLADLEERAKLGIHQQLKRRKIVLQYEIEMRRTHFQQSECQLQLQIAELNNKSSELQIKCCIINSELNAIVLKREQPKKQSVSNEGKASFNQVDISPKKQVTRLLKLFGRKK